jgi:hypothetical protein
VREPRGGAWCIRERIQARQGRNGHGPGLTRSDRVRSSTEDGDWERIKCSPAGSTRRCRAGQVYLSSIYIHCQSGGWSPANRIGTQRGQKRDIYKREEGSREKRRPMDESVGVGMQNHPDMRATPRLARKREVTDG